MKLMLVLASDEILNVISDNIKPLGFDIIRYRHVLKAMDNIDEVDPTVIIISAKDFPRHWKILIQFARYERPKEICPIVIIKGENFPLEEAAKAFFIGVNGIIAEDMNHIIEVDRLQSILSRYIELDDKRKARRYHVEPWARFGFCMANPLNKAIVTTTVKTISAGGISFEADDPGLMENIPEDEEVAECSLRIGEDIISPICRVVRKASPMSMEFSFLAREEQIMLEYYLESIPLREVRLKEQIK